MKLDLGRRVNILLIFLMLILSLSCKTEESSSREGNSHGHDHDEHEPTKGPHGGRLLTNNNFSLEVTIYEKGVPPEFRVYAFKNEKQLNPTDVQLTIELERFGGIKDEIKFEPVDSYLLGTTEIREPHSFLVSVLANYKGEVHRFQYESFEGRTQLTPSAIRNAGIVIEKAGPHQIRTVLNLNGKISPNADRLLHLTPRYSGVVRELKKSLGESVVKDEVLATVESNESLQRFEIKSSMAGTVTEKNVVIGEFVKEGDSIYTVNDLSSVWADFLVYRRDYGKIRIGQLVTVESIDKSSKALGRVSYLAPIVDPTVQGMLLRVELPNPKGEWQQGEFATGELVVDESEVPIAVKSEAIQTFRDWNVVFINENNIFEIAILELGRRDKDYTEITSGLNAGQSYASENSFIIKADIGKSAATHDH